MKGKHSSQGSLHATPDKRTALGDISQISQCKLKQ
jgi:hypothetical protein